MFRKLLDQVKTGDNVGILRHQARRRQRGQNCCASQAPSSHTHFTVRSPRLVQGTRWPSHAFLQQLPSQFYWYDGRDRRDRVARRRRDGDAWRQRVSITVKLINPIAMEEGLRFAIREGSRTVGAGVVAKIIA
jgi:elongation factor Tu